MKKSLLANLFFLGSLFCFLPVNSFAQKDSTLIKRISKSFCDEFTKKDKSKLTVDNMEMELGLIILPLFSKYADEIEKEWGITIGDDDGMEKMGEKIGQDAAMNCPDFQSFIVNNLDAITDKDDKDKEISVSGNFVSVEAGLFSSILIKNKSGKEEKLWWFEYFDGADEVVKNASKLKSKAVTVKYKEMEIYDASLKEYRKIKVITGLTIVQ